MTDLWEAENKLREDPRTKNGLGSCPVCGVTIGGAHLMMLDMGFSADEIHRQHQNNYPFFFTSGRAKMLIERIEEEASNEIQETG